MVIERCQEMHDRACDGRKLTEAIMMLMPKGRAYFPPADAMLHFASARGQKITSWQYTCGVHAHC
jgi:hypothetical protein